MLKSTLDPNSEDSDLAVDLLLGTQGWRRFSCTSNLKILWRIMVTMLAALLQYVCQTTFGGMLAEIAKGAGSDEKMLGMGGQLPGNASGTRCCTERSTAAGRSVA